jgi:hypothetical protein
MGFQIYDKVLIRILLSQPLLEGFAHVFYDFDGKVHEHAWRRKDVKKTQQKT